MSEIGDVLSSVMERLESLAGKDEEIRRRLNRLGELLIQKFPVEGAAVAPPAVSSTAPPPAIAASAAHAHASPSVPPHLATIPQPRPAAPRYIEAPPVEVKPYEPRFVDPPLEMKPVEGTTEMALNRTIPPSGGPPMRFEGDRLQTPPTDADLELVEKRAKLKGDTCRWAAERRRRLAAGAVVSIDLAPHDREHISKAKELPGCFLWMCHLNAPEPREISDYETLGHAFDNLSRAAAVVKKIRDVGPIDELDLHRALDLLAESQSAVRAGIAAMNGPVDTDQMAVFLWLRQTAAEERYYIRRHMRLDDPAPATQWAELEQRLIQLDERIEESGKKGKKRKRLMAKIAHELKEPTKDSETNLAVWQGVAEAVDELVKEGMAPSNRELRDILLPMIDEMPEMDPMPWGFTLAMRAIDQHLAATPPAPVRSNGGSNVPEVVKQVAQLLRGKTIVLIGGDRRPAAEEALVEAFELDDVYWIETREHQSISGFESYIARPEVAAVLLAIRWSSHSFGEVKGFCDAYKKPLVRLPGGYNPTQVATQIQQQCSEQLRAQ